MGSLNRNSLIIGLVVGLVLGLLLGMVLFWGLFPVKWTDAQSYDLAPEGRAEYVALVADSYKQDNDPARAAKHLELWEDIERQQAIADAIQMYEAEGRADKVQGVQDLAMVLNIIPGAPTVPGEAPVPEEPAGKNLWERIRVPCLVFFFILLILVLGWIGFRVAMRQRQQKAAAPRAAPAVTPAPVMAPAEDWEGVGQPPLGHFFTTYQWGEDTYDESFSIETPMGEFLGECGVGISETIGTGEHDKVTAFEVWLFDKSDIRTVTKVLMSDYAFNDENLRAKLASKGEAVLAQPGEPFALETTGLKVQVGVNELEYGEGESPQSYFAKLTIELVAMAKQPEAGETTF